MHQNTSKILKLRFILHFVVEIPFPKEESYGFPFTNILNYLQRLLSPLVNLTYTKKTRIIKYYLTQLYFYSSYYTYRKIRILTHHDHQ